MPIPLDDEIARLREAVRRQPHEVAQQIWLLAALALRDGLESSAVRAFRAMVRLKPDWTQLHFDVVEYWDDRGASSQTLLEAFEKERRRTPGDPVALYALGLVLQQALTLDRAIETYRELIALRPDVAVAHHNLGLCLNLLGRRDEAARACLRAADLAPTMAEPHFLLCSYYGREKRPRKAAYHCQKFLNLAYPYLEKLRPQAEISMVIFGGTKEGLGRRIWRSLRRRLDSRS